MAEKKNSEANVETVQKPKALAEKRFPLESFAENCMELFGITISTFAGATAKLDIDGEYTKSEIERTITKWMETEVK